MSEPANTPTTQPQQIPEELALEVRRIAHELSNALEIVVQTSYLLSMAELKEPASDWLRMLDSGVNKALESNQQLREYIKAHSPK
jgi:transcription initiation factor IIE alpha subunit